MWFVVMRLRQLQYGVITPYHSRRPAGRVCTSPGSMQGQLTAVELSGTARSPADLTARSLRRRARAGFAAGP